MRKINTSNEQEIIEYEKFLFRAFPYEKKKNLEKYFNIDFKNRRYAPVIPYTAREIFINKPASIILSAVSIVPISYHKLELEVDGFTVDKTEANTCEGLHFVNIGDMTLFRKFLEDVLTYLKSNGMIKFYITCDTKRVKQYELEGFVFIDSITNENGFVVNLMKTKFKN